MALACGIDAIAVMIKKNVDWSAQPRLIIRNKVASTFRALNAVE